MAPRRGGGGGGSGSGIIGNSSSGGGSYQQRSEESDQGGNFLGEHYFFLLEFFVQKIEGSRLAKLNQMFFVPTIVSFEFLEFRRGDGIHVTPVDPLFEPQAGIADDVEYFYSGRSVLFALEQSDVTDKLLELVVRVIVRKSMPEGLKPDILVGIGQIDLSRHFAALRKEMLQCWHAKMPPSKVFEGCVPLVHEHGIVGDLELYVRLSAYGRSIVTEFEAPPVGKLATSYVFKAEDVGRPTLAYKCRVVNPEEVDIADSCEALPCRICVPERTTCAPCGRPGAIHNASREPKRGSSSKNCGNRTSPSPSPPTCRKRGSSSLSPTPMSARTPGGNFIRGKFPQTCGKAVVLKVSGLLDNEDGRKPCVTVAPESEAVGPNNPPDPEHDVFILRIGKKGLVGAGEKSDLQLEMRTPKKPELGPPIRYETREMQTDDKKRRNRKKLLEKFD